MEYGIGAGLGVAIGVLGTVAGFDRDRVFYPAALIVIASYYVLFAVMGGSGEAVIQELPGVAVFCALSVIGFRTNLWIVAAGIVGHGLFDLVHGLVIDNPGKPDWWPGFCGSIDVVLGAYLAWRLSAFSIEPRLAARRVR